MLSEVGSTCCGCWKPSIELSAGFLGPGVCSTFSSLDMFTDNIIEISNTHFKYSISNNYFNQYSKDS